MLARIRESKARGFFDYKQKRNNILENQGLNLFVITHQKRDNDACILELLSDPIMINRN